MSDPTLFDVRQVLQDAIDDWPEFDNDDEQVSGCDLVEWFGNWRERAKAALAAPVITPTAYAHAHSTERQSVKDRR